MPAINVLIKPASSSCNLNCKYCFYDDVTEHRNKKNYGLMSHNILEEIVKKVFEFGEHSVGFAFQGGEPTLVGIDFYKTLLKLQEKYNTKRIKVNNAIQTNGIVINDEWAEFLSVNNFLVGISLDGSKEIHDLNRVDKSGTGSYNRVEKTIEIFNKYGVQYNVLCVVTKAVSRHVEKVYKYFSKKGFRYLQFIPCLDEMDTEPGKTLYSVTPKDYGEFLIRLFDLWYMDLSRGNVISIRLFDNIVGMLLGYSPESCDMKGFCSANIVLEADGSVYPCDFYVLDEWKMGNVMNDDFYKMLQSEKAKSFVEASKKLSEDCKQCEFLATCRGGCRRHYEPIKDESTNKNYFCSSYKDFYKHTLIKFYEIAKVEKLYFSMK